jgi:hypothetical protein
LKLKVMNTSTVAALIIRDKIARSRERIARWDKEAGEVEPSWTGGPYYRQFCEGMAGAAREKSRQLEAELKHLPGYRGEPELADKDHCRLCA